MTDTAELIARAWKRTALSALSVEESHDKALIEEMATALAAQEQEIERLKERKAGLEGMVIAADQRAEAAEARVREMEAVVAQIQPPDDIGDNCTAELAVKCAALQTDRDAIEAKTIERCAKLMESDYFRFSDGAAAIRALPIGKEE